jgi:flagellar hook-length control protein FliK
MLDNNALNSVLGTGGTRSEGKTKDTPIDAEAFGQALDEAGAKNKPAKAKEKESEGKDKEAKKQEAKEHDEARTKSLTQDKTGAIHLKKLMSKNVDTLSLAEKQALRIAEFADESAQNAKTTVQMGKAQQAPMAQAKSSTPQAAKAARSESKPVVSEAAQSKERQEESAKQVAEEKAKTEQAKGGGNLEQMLAKEAKFTEEIRQASATERNQERQSVIDQIMQQIEVRNFANRTELHMRLNPEYLGELKVKLVHTDDGIRADFQTSSRQTRALLREAEDELKTQAADKGVRLRSMRVTLVEEVEGIEKS